MEGRRLGFKLGTAVFSWSKDNKEDPDPVGDRHCLARGEREAVILADESGRDHAQQVRIGPLGILSLVTRTGSSFVLIATLSK